MRPPARIPGSVLPGPRRGRLPLPARGIRTISTIPAIPITRSSISTTLRLRPRLRPYSSLQHPHQHQAPLPMPPDQPREDYATPAMYTLSYISRIVRLVLLSAFGIAAAGLTGYEAWHLYIEHVCLRCPATSITDPSPSASASVGDGDGDEDEGWADENVSWTGGLRGGTDPALGWRARHALRGAWTCQEWGAGGTASATSMVRGGMGSEAGGAALGSVDRGLELAEEYLDLAIKEARTKGLVFPEPEPASASAPASASPSPEQRSAQVGASVSATATDLVLLKAGVLERIGSPASLRAAKGLYEDVLRYAVPRSLGIASAPSARELRLLGKIGDLEQRVGGDGRAFWLEGLRRAGVDTGLGGLADIASSAVAAAAPVLASGEKEETKRVGGWGWFGSGSGKGKDETAPVASGTPPLQARSVAAAGTETSSTPPALTPAALRAALSLLISLEASLAQSTSFPAALRAQDAALALIPTSNPSPASSAPAPSPPRTLHAAWLAHRRALLTLHRTSVLYAQARQSGGAGGAGAAARVGRAEAEAGQLELATTAVALAERSLASMPLATPGLSLSASASAEKGGDTSTSPDPRARPGRTLMRDAVALVAEAAYTRGVMLERVAGAGAGTEGSGSGSGSGKGMFGWGKGKGKAEADAGGAEKGAAGLEAAKECFERAMGVSGEYGLGEAGEGNEGGRYWRAWARVGGKLEKAREAAEAERKGAVRG